MSATRFLLRLNKAATGWAVLACRNGTAPSLPSCFPSPDCATLVRRNGNVPAAVPSCSPFPYCATLARHNGTAPAFPSVSPAPYRISSFIGPRHMSSNDRRGLLVDTIALRLEAEGIPTETIKIITEFLNDVDQSFDSKGEMQKNNHFSLLQREIEELRTGIEKMRKEFSYEIDKATAGRRLHLNLERDDPLGLRPRDHVAPPPAVPTPPAPTPTPTLGQQQRLALLLHPAHLHLCISGHPISQRGHIRRICDELANQDAETVELTTKLDREIHALRAHLEAAKYDTIKYFIGTLVPISVVGLVIIHI